MAGCGANSTAEAIELAKYARKVGADCQLQVVPYYNKPDAGRPCTSTSRRSPRRWATCRWFFTTCPAAPSPIMLHDTVLRLAQVPGIVGIKEATGNVERAQWLIRDAAQGLFRLFR